MSPRAFQRFVADRIDAMGLEVQIVGDVYRPDGGIDIVAYPKIVTFAFPFLLGIQVKHHATGANVGSPDIRNLAGVLLSPGFRFNIGMLVTNTAFTPDARWFAENHAAMLRLRDMDDLRRWLFEDFQNEAEWREIPDKIIFGAKCRDCHPPTKDNCSAMSPECLSVFCRTHMRTRPVNRQKTRDQGEFALKVNL